MVYLRLTSVQLALRGIAACVRQGGHDLPRVAVVHRFSRGWENFHRVYRPLADSWAVYDNSNGASVISEQAQRRPKHDQKIPEVLLQQWGAPYVVRRKMPASLLAFTAHRC